MFMDLYTSGRFTVVLCILMLSKDVTSYESNENVLDNT